MRFVMAAVTMLAMLVMLIANRASAEPSRRPPNIIVIFADDLGYADVSAYAKGRIPTPNIDRLGRQGVRFTSGYATASVCSPSRAALLTGRYQQRFGFEYLVEARGQGAAESGLPVGQATMADALKARGYATAVLGKWHLGTARKFWPTERGFDEFFGFLRGEMAHVDANTPGTHSAEVAYLGARNFHRDANSTMVRLTVGASSPTPVDNGSDYMPDVLTREATGYIQRHREKPFFLYVAHHAPHSPLQVTDKYWKRFPSISSKPQRIYAGMVSALDDSVGAIMAAVNMAGIARDTIIVFASDNGCAGYMGQGICDCSVLSGAKLGQGEGGSRVPFIVSAPGRLPQGRVDDRPVSTLDVLPTVIAAIDGKPASAGLSLDGIDLATLYSGAPAEERPLFFRMQPMSWMRLGDWKLIRDSRLAAINVSGYGTARNAVITGLFNLRTDPHERRDVAYENPAKVAELSHQLDRWEATLKPPAWPGTDSRYFFCGTMIDARN